MRFISVNLLKAKDGSLAKAVKVLRKPHKIIGGVILASTIVHGVLVLGSLSLHTGTVVGILVVITVIIGIIFGIYKKKTVFKLHKVFAGLFVLMLIIHLVFPWLI